MSDYTEAERAAIDRMRKEDYLRVRGWLQLGDTERWSRLRGNVETVRQIDEAVEMQLADDRTRAAFVAAQQGKHLAQTGGAGSASTAEDHAARIAKVLDACDAGIVDHDFVARTIVGEIRKAREEEREARAAAVREWIDGVPRELTSAMRDAERSSDPCGTLCESIAPIIAERIARATSS